MTALVCGSFAYDTIMVFEDQFKNHILPDQVHILNVSFMVPKLRREFGGCAGNIVFNLRMLGGDVLPMGTVGDDFGPYAEWMDRHGISRQFVTVIPGTYTAQAFITTDRDANQITAFHPGAMLEAHRNQVAQASGITIGMVSPDGRDGMIEHARQFAAMGIPFFFDPGQGMPMFNGDDLRQFIELADYVVVNDYEWQMMQERTGLSAEQAAAQLRALIVTRGGEGSWIYTQEGKLDIPPAKAEAVIDPTGCGDAFRAGLLFGLMHGWDWQTTGRVASLMGAIKIAQPGTQNHRITLDSFQALYRAQFGMNLPANS